MAPPTICTPSTTPNANGTTNGNGKAVFSDPDVPKPSSTIDLLETKIKTFNADMRIKTSMDGSLDMDGLSSLYTSWANEYESNYEHVGYEGPKNVAEALKEHLPVHLKPESTRVFDAGCGTGLICKELQTLGFKDIHGVDFSQGMLKHAASRGYSSLTEANLMMPLNFKARSFDAVITCGVFTSGHVKKTALYELIRITRAGGLMSIGVQELVYQKDDYPGFIKDLENMKLVRKVAVKTVYTMNKISTEMFIILLQVL